MATPACDVLFVLSNLARGRLRTQDRAHGQPAQGRGRCRDPGLSQRAVHDRADAAPRRAAAPSSSASGKFSFATVLAPAADDPARAAGDGGRGESLPGAVRGLRHAAAAASAAHRGAGEHLDVPRPAYAQAALSVGARALRPHRARLARRNAASGSCAAPRGPWKNPRSSTTAWIPNTSSPVESFEAANGCAPRSASSRSRCCSAPWAGWRPRRTRKCC